jgi:hypothetical protein
VRKRFKFFEGIQSDEELEPIPLPSDYTYYRTAIFDDHIVRYIITTTSPEYVVDLIFNEVIDEIISLEMSYDMATEYMMNKLQNQFLYVDYQY